MQPRRLEVVPDPLDHPDKATDSNNNSTNNGSVSNENTSVATGAAAVYPGVVRPRLFRVASPAVAPSSATPMGGLEPFSPGLNVYRGGSSVGVTTAIAPKTRVLVDHHVTNTGAVVRLEQVDYSKAMRAYRVCRQEGWVTPNGDDSNNSHVGNTNSGAGGNNSANTTPTGSSVGCTSGAAAAASAFNNTTTSPAAPVSSPTSAAASASCAAANYNGNSNNGNNSGGSPAFSNHNRGVGGNGSGEPCHCPAPWRVVLLRLFSAADIMLLAIAVACFLVVVSRLRLTQQTRGRGGYSNSQNTRASDAATSWAASLLAGLVARNSRDSQVGVAAADAPEKISTGGVRNVDGSNSSSTIASSGRQGAVMPSVFYTQVTRAASLNTSFTFVLLLFSVLLLAKRLINAFSRVYVEEVLVMRGVGLQFSSYGIFNTLRYKIFVDLQMLRSLVIHDAFFRYQPIFYLSSSVENRPERMVYFPDTLPRLAVLRPVLNGIRGVLYGEPEEGPSLAESEERWKTSSREISEEELLTEDSFAEDTVTTPDEGRSSDGTVHEQE